MKSIFVSGNKHIKTPLQNKKTKVTIKSIAEDKTRACYGKKTDIDCVKYAHISITDNQVS